MGPPVCGHDLRSAVKCYFAVGALFERYRAIELPLQESFDFGGSA